MPRCGLIWSESESSHLACICEQSISIREGPLQARLSSSSRSCRPFTAVWRGTTNCSNISLCGRRQEGVIRISVFKSKCKHKQLFSGLCSCFREPVCQLLLQQTLQGGIMPATGFVLFELQNMTTYYLIRFLLIDAEKETYKATNQSAKSFCRLGKNFPLNISQHSRDKDKRLVLFVFPQPTAPFLVGGV